MFRPHDGAPEPAGMYKMRPTETIRGVQTMERDEFQTEAIETLRREVPEDLEWIPWRKLPAQRWRGDDTSVDERVPRGWLVMAAEHADPRPNVRIRQQAALFTPETGAALATWLLRAWIEYDTTVTGLSEARKVELRGMAEKAAQLAQRLGRGGTDPDERYQQLLTQEGNAPAPTALPHRGLLAVVAACGAPVAGDLTADVDRYTAAWEDGRPARCRALREMLSCIEASS